MCSKVQRGGRLLGGLKPRSHLSLFIDQSTPGHDVTISASFQHHFLTDDNCNVKIRAMSQNRKTEKYSLTVKFHERTHKIQKGNFYAHVKHII